METTAQVNLVNAVLQQIGPSMPSYQELDVEQLGELILEQIAAAQRDERTSLAHAIQAGDLFLKAKTQLKHGEWLPFLERHKIEKRTAQRHMRLADAHAKGRLDPNATRAAYLDLSIRAAEEIVSASRSPKAEVKPADREPMTGGEAIEAESQDGESKALPPPAEGAPQKGKAEPTSRSTKDGDQVDHQRVQGEPPDPTPGPPALGALPVVARGGWSTAEDEPTPSEDEDEPEPELGSFARIREAIETLIYILQNLGEADLAAIPNAEWADLAALRKDANAALKRLNQRRPEQRRGDRS